VSSPQRITPELCGILKQYDPLYINTHFNHPDELTAAAVAALAASPTPASRSAARRCSLKGVNDDPEVMKRLMQKLLAARVRPYYIYMCDQVRARSTSGPRSRRAWRSSGRCAGGPRARRCRTS